MDGLKKARCCVFNHHKMGIFFLFLSIEEYVDLLKVVKVEIYDLGEM